MARIKEVSRSNLVRRLPIGRLREKGRMGGGAARRSSSSRGGWVAGVSESGAPGLILGCGLVQRNQGDVRNPLGYLGRWCGIGSMALDGEGGSAAHRREISHGAGTDRGKRRHGEFCYRGVKLWDHLAGEGRRRRAGAGAAELRAWRGYGGARGEGRRRRGLLASDLHERGLRLAAKPRR